MVRGDISIVGEYRPDQTGVGSLYVARFDGEDGLHYEVSSDHLFPEPSILGTAAHIDTSPGGIARIELHLATRLQATSSERFAAVIGRSRLRVAGALLQTVVADAETRPNGLAVVNTQTPQFTAQLGKLGFSGDVAPFVGPIERILPHLAYLGANLVNKP